MATVEECERALHELAARLAAKDGSDSRRALDRTLTCDLKDLGVVFAGRLRDGRLEDVRRLPGSDGASPNHRASGSPGGVSDAAAQVKLAMKSDDLIRLVGGHLNMASAWATGRVKVDASMRDILRLRSIF